MTPLRDLLDLPARVNKSDFVIKLTEGVDHPDTLLRDYAVTADLCQEFQRALGFARSAIEDRTSTAVYIHGSFGSGKSHFMAILSLILQNHPAPFANPDLHPVLAEHEWLKQRRVLRLHLNMAGAETVDKKVFPAYIGLHRPGQQAAPRRAGAAAVRGRRAVRERARAAGAAR